MRLTAAMLLVLLGTAPLAAKDVFVNNEYGDDFNDGQFPDVRGGKNGPLRSIEAGLMRGVKGDRIIIANTGIPYRECLGISVGRLSGYSSRPTIIVGNGAVLDGSGPVPIYAWEHYKGDVYRFRPHRKGWQQLFLDGIPARRQYAAPPEIEPPALEPLEWALVRGYIYFRTEENLMPDYYPLTFSRMDVGFTLYNVHEIVIDNLVIQGFRLDGVNVADNVRDCILSGLTCRGNGRSGIAVEGASRVKIYGCLLGDNAEAQLLMTDYCEVTVRDTDLVPSPHAPDVVREGGDLDLVPWQPEDAGQDANAQENGQVQPGE